eukprot:356565-Chlamydomonas_euryale.AAC.7
MPVHKNVCAQECVCACELDRTCTAETPSNAVPWVMWPGSPPFSPHRGPLPPLPFSLPHAPAIAPALAAGARRPPLPLAQREARPQRPSPRPAAGTPATSESAGAPRRLRAVRRSRQSRLPWPTPPPTASISQSFDGSLPAHSRCLETRQCMGHSSTSWDPKRLGTWQRMGPGSARYPAVHGTLQRMGPCSAWDPAVHGTRQCTVPGSALYPAVHGTRQCMGPCSAWDPAVHGIRQRMGP